MKTYIPSDLVHIALIVSLLRFFPELYNNPRWGAEPLVREVLLGANSAYTQTNFHNLHNRLDGYLNSKNVDDYLSTLFRHDFGRFSRSFRRNEIYVPRNNVIAYIVNVNHLTNGSTVASEDTTSGSTRTAVEEGISDSVTSGSDLTQEDMDLIEILWKQDIDLGISRDVFDGTWSSGQDFQREVEKIPPKEVDCINDPEKEELEQAVVVPDPWQGLQYTIDSETGEHIIHNAPCQPEEPSPIQLPREALQNMGFQEALQLFEGDTYHVYPPAQQVPLCNNQMEEGNENDVMLDNTQLLLEQLNELERLSLEARTEPHDSEVGMEADWSTPQPLPSSEMDLPSESTAFPYEPEAMNVSDSQLFQASNMLNDVLLHNTTMPSVNQSANYSSAISDFQMQPLDDRQFLEFLEMLANGSDPDAGAVGSPTGEEITDFFCTNLTNGVSDYLSQLLADEDLNLMDFTQLADESEQVIPKVEESNEADDSGDSAISCTSLQSPRSDPDWLDSASDVSQPRDSESKYQYTSLPYSKESMDNVEVKAKDSHSGIVLPATLSNNSSDNADSVLSSDSEKTLRKHSSCDRSPNLSEDSNSSEKFFHNHTYHLQSPDSCTSQKSVERDKKLRPEITVTRHQTSRDERRAKSMKIPFSNQEIINLSIEDFNELISKHDLTEAQLTLIRDIRRRGKNKVAAQNCRKRKLNQIFDLEVEMSDMQSQRTELELENEELLQHRRFLKEKYDRLYQFVFQSPGPPDPHGFGSQLTDREDQSAFHAGANSTSQECSKETKSRTRAKRKQDKK